MVTRREVCGRADELPDGRCVETGEDHDPGEWLSTDLRDRHGQGVVRGQLDVAIGPHEEHGHLAELAGEEAQEEDRRRVGCVQIVDDDEHRPCAGSVAQQRRRRVEQLEACRLRTGFGRRQQIREQFA